MSPGGPPKKVLIVEDEDSVRESLVSIFDMEGYATAAARHGLEAVDLIESTFQPDVILLDLMMPVMDGWEFFGFLKQNEAFAHIPVIVISAARDELQRTIMPNMTIAKPINLDQLLEGVQNCTRTTPPHEQ